MKSKAINGKNLISVTTALGIIRMPFLETWRGSIGNKMADEILEASIEFGKTFHKAAENINKGKEENNNDISEEFMKKCITDYEQWFFENVEEILVSEDEVYSEKYGIYGHPDIVAKLKGFKSPVLLDIKTGKVIDKKVGYQTAGYVKMINEMKNVKISDRIVLHIRPGLFKQIILEKKNLESDFMALLYAKELYCLYNS